MAGVVRGESRGEERDREGESSGLRDGRRRRLGRRKSCSPSTLKNAPAISFPSPNRSWDTYPGIPDRALPYGGVAGRGVQCSMISASEAEAVVHPSRLAVAKPLRLSLVSPLSLRPPCHDAPVRRNSKVPAMQHRRLRCRTGARRSRSPQRYRSRSCCGSARSWAPDARYVPTSRLRLP